jgi:hypothetical protein
LTLADVHPERQLVLDLAQNSLEGDYAQVLIVAKLAVFMSLALRVARAKVSTGTIVGVVDDNTGGVVPNASVSKSLPGAFLGKH